MKITHQLKEVNQAYKDIDELITEQEEVVVQIAEHAEEAKDGTEGALQQVQQADAKTKYCHCSKTRLCIASFVILIVLILVLSIVLAR